MVTNLVCTGFNVVLLFCACLLKLQIVFALVWSLFEFEILRLKNLSTHQPVSQPRLENDVEFRVKVKVRLLPSSRLTVKQ